MPPVVALSSGKRQGVQPDEAAVWCVSTTVRVTAGVSTRAVGNVPGTLQHRNNNPAGGVIAIEILLNTRTCLHWLVFKGEERQLSGSNPSLEGLNSEHGPVFSRHSLSCKENNKNDGVVFQSLGWYVVFSQYRVGASEIDATAASPHAY